MRGISLAVQCLRLHASNARGVGSIPAWGTKIPHASWYGQEKNKIPSAGEHPGQPELSYIAGGNTKWGRFSGIVWQVLIKLNITLTLWLSNPSPICLPKRNKNWCAKFLHEPKLNEDLCARKNLSVNAHSSIIHSSQKVETTQRPINWWKDK